MYATRLRSVVMKGLFPAVSLVVAGFQVSSAPSRADAQSKAAWDVSARGGLTHAQSGKSEQSAASADFKGKMLKAWDTVADKYSGANMSKERAGPLAGAHKLCAQLCIDVYGIPQAETMPGSQSGHSKGKGLTILDIASAGGEPAVTIAKALPLATIHATDFSPTMVEAMQRRLRTMPEITNITPQVADGENLSKFEDGSVDVVTCVFGLMFMDIDKSFKEVYRVLKPGGMAIMTVWSQVDETDLIRFMRDIINTLTPDMEQPMDSCWVAAGSYPGEMAEKKLQEAGFAHTEIGKFNVAFEGVPLDDFYYKTILGTPFAAHLKAAEANGYADISERAATVFKDEMKLQGYVDDNGNISLKRNTALFFVCRKSP